MAQINESWGSMGTGHTFARGIAAAAATAALMLTTAGTAGAGTTIDTPPAGITLPTPTGATVTTEGGELRHTTALLWDWYGTAGGYHVETYYSPLGWLLEVERYTSDGHAEAASYRQGTPWSWQPRPVFRPTLAHRRTRQIRHCGRPVVDGNIKYVAMLARGSSWESCAAFATAGLRIVAFDAIRSYYCCAATGTLPVPDGWTCTRGEVAMRCTDSAGHCIELVESEALADTQLRRAYDARGRYRWAAGPLPCV